MTRSEFEARLRSLLSDLYDHLTTEQFDNAISSAIEVTQAALPCSDSEKTQALLNRGEFFCLETLQNDWLPRFDLCYGQDRLSRADVARQIERKLARLASEWERLSLRLNLNAGRSSRAVAVKTAYRA